MEYVLIRHKVNDFGTWKSVFDQHADARAQAGFQDVFLWQVEHDATDVVLLAKVTNPQAATDFITSPELKTAMEAAGVASQPEIVFLNQA